MIAVSRHDNEEMVASPQIVFDEAVPKPGSLEHATRARGVFQDPVVLLSFSSLLMLLVGGNG